MKTAADQIKQELTALQACFDTVRQLPNNREVGRFLVEEFIKKPALPWYWRAAASKAAFTPAMMRRLKHEYAPRLRGMIIDHTLLQEAGVSVALLKKVFEKRGEASIDDPIDEPTGLTIRITSCGSIPTGHATAAFEIDGRRFGNATFIMDKTGQKGMAALRVLVPFVVPEYIQPWGSNA